MNQVMPTPSSILSAFPANRSSEPGGAQLIDRYLAESYILVEDWDNLPLSVQESVLLCPNRGGMLDLLIEHGLMTEYQAGRIQAGTTFGLVLGNYRILDRIGAGGMAVVFLAEHLDLRHIVAIKVLPSMPNQDARLEHRFFAEMRTIAQLRHPNIVAATDAGRAMNPDPNGASYRYIVMEHVCGKDLEEFVISTGPLPVGRACGLIYQIASALMETAKYKLVHRDIKPSNIMVTPEEQAKLLDFGLSMHFDRRQTTPGTVLGTIDFMAPEQARDASTVDIRADIYGLGGTLFYALTGRLPFGQVGSPAECLARRLTSKPPSLSAYLPDCPEDLERFVAKMMALDPADRFQTPQEVMQGLLPFIRLESPEHYTAPILTPGHRPSSVAPTATTSPRVLVVDDEQNARDFARHVLEMHDVQCDLVESGEQALDALALKDYDLILLDLFMPGIQGREVLQRVRSNEKLNNVKIIILSGQATADEMALLLNEGADDFLSKPFSLVQFQGRVRAALRLKAAQDRTGYLNQELVATNVHLERSLHASSLDLSATRRAVVLGLSHLVELRDARGARHLTRMQRYCRAIAEVARKMPEFENRIDSEFISMLECCVPLHDIGKVGLPDHILMKSGILSAEERILMQTHTTFAADTWHLVARDYPGARAFLDMTIDVIRHHHERFDGGGYPDNLAGDAIPLAARIAAICDVYDALRSRKSHRPSLSHSTAMKIVTSGSPGQFDPALLRAFQTVAEEFHEIYSDDPN